MRKFLVYASIFLMAGLLLPACGAPATSVPAPATQPPATAAPPTAAPAKGTPAVPRSKDPTTLTLADSDVSIDTLDPALAYDVASAEIIQNTYDTLIFYDGSRTDAFVPLLSAEMPAISADSRVYTFKIRSGVKFHNGDVLTPSDVAFSFQRGLLQGGASSPQWLLSEPFFGVGYQDVTFLLDGTGALWGDRDALVSLPAEKLAAVCEKIKAAIVADDAAGTVTMTLATPWGPFLGTIAQDWGSIMDKKWVGQNGGWNGSCATWQNFYAMTSAEDPFSSIENGTGPFVLTSLKQGEEYTLERFDAYFKGPAKLQHIVAKVVPEWGTRFAMMQTGDIDVTYVPDGNRSQMDVLVGEKCLYNLARHDFGPCEVTDPEKPFRVYLGQPPNWQDVIVFNWDISTSPESPNAYLGSGKLDGDGIPPDFFADVHVRKAFAYCFDWDTLINDVYKGEAIQSIAIVLPGMPGYFDDIPHYSMDLARCAEEFKASTLKSTEGKSLWEIGFRVQMIFPLGNVTRQTMSEILTENIAQVNPKFQVETLGLLWTSFLHSQRAELIPIMTGSWLEDIHDPHNWYQPYTLGIFAGRSHLPDDLKVKFKAILDAGVAETDPIRRGEIYREANQLFFDQVVGIPTVLATGHGYCQRWLHFDIRNPLFPGFHYYEMHKD